MQSGFAPPRLALLLALAASAACGDDPAQGQGGGGGQGGAYEPPDATKSKQEPPTFTVGGFSVALPPTILAPGDETHPCFIAPLELVGPSKVVGGGQMTTTKGMHHGNITARPKTGEGFRSCPPDESQISGEADDVLAGGTVLFGSTTQYEGTEWRVFPDGMGFPIGDDWEIVFRMHYLNTTPEPLELAPAYEWYTIDEARVTHLLGPFIWVYSGFEIAPHSALTVEASCAAPQSMHIVSVMPHMHKLGRRCYAGLSNGAPGDTSGALFLDTPGYNPDGLIAMYDPPVDVSQAGGFRYGCTWQNTFDKPIVEGVGDNEMCMLFGYAYPYENALSAYASGGGACITLRPPPPGGGVGQPGAGGAGGAN